MVEGVSFMRFEQGWVRVPIGIWFLTKPEAAPMTNAAVPRNSPI